MDISFKDFPILQTERLVLRDVKKTDAQAIFLLRSVPASMQYMDSDTFTEIEQAEGFIQKILDGYADGSGITWAVELKDNPGKMIGYVAFVKIIKDDFRAEVAYSILPDFWQLGIATEAMTSIIDYGFNTLKLHSFEANINKYNKASEKLLQKLGFKKEAHFRENYYYNGEFIDSVIYGLLKSDFIK